MSNRLAVPNFTAAVGIDTAEHYKQVAERLNGIKRPMGGLALGILMSEKTGLIGIENRHGRQLYPLFEEVEAIAAAREAHPNNPLGLIVHYNSDHNERVAGQLVRALAPIINTIDGVQINGLTFEQASKLDTLKAAYPDLAIIMQIHSKLLEQYLPHELAAMVNKTHPIDVVWLDDSGGLGKRLDPTKLLPYIDTLAQETDIGIGLGGGLGPYNLDAAMAPILIRHPNVSWDAQQGVQSRATGRPAFDTDQAHRFLVASSQMRNKYPAA